MGVGVITGASILWAWIVVTLGTAGSVVASDANKDHSNHKRMAQVQKHNVQEKNYVA